MHASRTIRRRPRRRGVLSMELVFTLPILAIDGDEHVDPPEASAEPAVVRPERAGS